MRRKFFKGWKRFFHLQKWYILHFFNPLWRLHFGLKTQKTPLDHVLDSKIQSTRRVGVLVTLFERYDPNKAFKKNFWVPVTWEKILETSKVREAISQNSLFELSQLNDIAKEAMEPWRISAENRIETLLAVEQFVESIKE